MVLLGILTVSFLDKISKFWKKFWKIFFSYFYFQFFFIICHLLPLMHFITFLFSEWGDICVLLDLKNLVIVLKPWYDIRINHKKLNIRMIITWIILLLTLLKARMEVHHYIMLSSVVCHRFFGNHLTEN